MLRQSMTVFVVLFLYAQNHTIFFQFYVLRSIFFKHNLDYVALSMRNCGKK